MDLFCLYLTQSPLTYAWRSHTGGAHSHTRAVQAWTRLDIDHSAVFWQQVTQVSCHACLEAHQVSVATYTHKTTIVYFTVPVWHSLMILLNDQ